MLGYVNPIFSLNFICLHKAGADPGNAKGRALRHGL
jgi:hypothetical protein